MINSSANCKLLPTTTATVAELPIPSPRTKAAARQFTIPLIDSSAHSKLPTTTTATLAQLPILSTTTAASATARQFTIPLMPSGIEPIATTSNNTPLANFQKIYPSIVPTATTFPSSTTENYRIEGINEIQFLSD